MEDRLNQILLEGETVRWSGRPAPFRLMACSSRNHMIASWVISAAVMLLAIFVLLPYTGPRPLSESLLILLVIGFAPVLISTRPLLDKRILERKTFYAITNYRIIAIVKDDIMYIPISKQLQVAVEAQDANHGSLRFNETIGKASSKALAHAVVGIRQEGALNNMRGMLFYHIPEPEQLLHYFA